MLNWKEWLSLLWQDEEGQGMVEYGLILALIAVVVIAALTLIGQNLQAKYNQVNQAIQ